MRNEARGDTDIGIYETTCEILTIMGVPYESERNKPTQNDLKIFVRGFVTTALGHCVAYDNTGSIFTTLYFLRNLQVSPLS